MTTPSSPSPASGPTPRQPDHVHLPLDPTRCEILEGHQHVATDIEELADSIVTLGQLHPALVIQDADGRHWIAAGRRRWMACTRRGLPLIANVWVATDDDIQLELFARAIRVAENIQRKDPSAMDVAIQLRTIRNEQGFRNARELALFMGMSESKVKSYLSLVRSSEALKLAATEHAIPLTLLLELAKCEKQIGERATMKLVDRVVKGELSARELGKHRARPKRPVGRRPKDAKKTLESSGRAFLKAVSEAPESALPLIESLLEELSALVPHLPPPSKAPRPKKSGA